jgi:hypothetical protein
VRGGEQGKNDDFCGQIHCISIPGPHGRAECRWLSQGASHACSEIPTAIRYDETGLIWFNGREITVLTADTAAIRSPSGSLTIYRKNNKPALGPLGDSLDDFK